MEKIGKRPGNYFPTDRSAVCRSRHVDDSKEMYWSTFRNVITCPDLRGKRDNLKRLGSDQCRSIIIVEQTESRSACGHIHHLRK